MIDTALSFIAPHHCYGCGKIGHLLCDNCKYNINSEPYGHCIVCQKPALSQDALCQACQVPYQRAWCVGERIADLRELISAFKFQNAKAAHRPLAELLDATLPDLPSSTVLVPIPTISAHIRQRGYDHTLLVARHMAKLRKLALQPVLGRATATKQLGASRSQRNLQAKGAFTCPQTLDPDVPYLLIDDVITTGATLKYAAKTLQAAGATQVWVAVISRQPLEN